MIDKRQRYRFVLCLAVFIIMIGTLAGCSQVRRRRTGGMYRMSSATPDNTNTITGVITMQNTAESKLTIRELNSNVESILHYDSTAVVTNQYQETITADHLELGQIIEAAYTPGDAALVTASVPKDVWEYKEVGNFSFQEAENMMRFAGEKYQYSDLTYIVAGEQKIQREDINKHDELTVRGVGYRVYSIVRTSGHGYIRLANYADFLGGMAELGSGQILPITENMLITAREGIYQLSLVNGAMVTSKTITVVADQEVVADFSDYVPAVENVGLVTFSIEPEGADLYLNGTAVSYSEPVALNYGEYRVRVTMTGYQDYTGILDVAESSSTVNINLIEETAGVDGEESKKTPAPSQQNANDGTDSTKDSSAVKSVDSAHTITVTAPKNAEVYLDNVYKGMAPCKFKKVIGSQTITLSRTGYLTKSYSVDILDDNEDVILSFPELPEDADDVPVTSSTAAPTSTGN